MESELVNRAEFSLLAWKSKPYITKLCNKGALPLEDGKINVKSGLLEESQGIRAAPRVTPIDLV